MSGLVALTPDRIDTAAADAVLIVSIPAGSHPTACARCREGGALAVGYYTGGRRDGQFYACSLTHAADEIAVRGRDLFPGVTA